MRATSGSWRNVFMPAIYPEVLHGGCTGPSALKEKLTDVLNQLRETVTPLKNALARPIAATGLSPNLFTLSALPLAAAAGLLVHHGHPGFALAAGIPSALVDFVDGPVARLQNRVTPFGNLLETVVDRCVDACLLVGLATRFPLAASTAMATSMIISYIKPRTALVVISDNREWPGWGDRSDRIVLILISILMLALELPRGAELCLWLVATASLVGIVQRLRYARRLIDESELLPYLKSDGEA